MFLIKILLGLYDLKEGQRLIDGVLSNDINLQIAYVAQKIEVFDMSIKENILLGRSIPQEKFFEIIKLVGLDTLNLEEDPNLSSGQLQKLAIARALIGDIKVLMLDEPVANLDEKSEIEISEILKKIDVTTIVISHRKKYFDWMKKYKIVK